MTFVNNYDRQKKCNFTEDRDSTNSQKPELLLFSDKYS